MEFTVVDNVGEIIQMPRGMKGIGIREEAEKKEEEKCCIAV